ncbi:MAG: mitochondrial fission ELM1 family protein [Hyphomicrobiaceae bacterium]|nr:mitochondrial fission ELM1 family protein [Hyphomicrobiaceae bacterium]
MALDTVVTEPDFEATHGRTGWIISDGKTGMDVQTRGVFDALGLDYEIKRVDPAGIFKMLSPYGPVSPAERFGTETSQFCPPWPDFAISVGRLTTPYIRRLKRLAGRRTYTVILQDPGVSTAAADLFSVPEHDRLRGPNVITTLTAPHSFTPRRLAELRRAMPPDIAALPVPRVAVLLGGPDGSYRYTKPALARLVTALNSLSGLRAGLMITPSRRTPAQVSAFVRDGTEGKPRLFWSGTGDNPYPHFLAHADLLITPGDSVNMVGEACATGKPVYIFAPDGGGAPKRRHFHAALARHGAARPLPLRFERLETWSYAPLNSAETIAAEIVRRWVNYSQIFGPASRP